MSTRQIFALGVTTGCFLTFLAFLAVDDTPKAVWFAWMTAISIVSVLR